MHKLRTLSFVILLGSVLFISSCSSSNNNSTIVGNWIARSEFGGHGRSEAVVFVVGDTAAFVTTGTDGTNISSPNVDDQGKYVDSVGRYIDMFKYISGKSQIAGDNGYWTECADFMGSHRSSAVAFAIGANGYVGTGYDGIQYLNDFFSYNSITNTWAQIASPGTAGCTPRYEAVGFAVNGQGYITTGYDGDYKNDCYQYTPGGGWVKQVAFYGVKRSQAAVFVSNNKAYVCTGQNNGNTTICNDLWQFDPTATPQWILKRPISNVSTDSYDDLYNIVRENAVGFVVDNVVGGTTTEYGYIACGETAGGGSALSDIWQYDIANDQWYQKQSYERSPRTGAVGFSVNGRGFLGTGRSGGATFDNFDEFLPLQAYNQFD